MAERVDEILQAHRSGAVSPADTVARSYRRIREHNDPTIFITLRAEADAIAEARALEGRSDLPLYVHSDRRQREWQR